MAVIIRVTRVMVDCPVRPARAFVPAVTSRMSWPTPSPCTLSNSSVSSGWGGDDPRVGTIPVTVGNPGRWGDRS